MSASLALLLALASATGAPATPVPQAAPAADAGIVVPEQSPAPALAECTPEAIASAEHPRLREGRCRRALRESREPGIQRDVSQVCEPLQGADGILRCIPVRGVRTAPPRR